MPCLTLLIVSTSPPFLSSNNKKSRPKVVTKLFVTTWLISSDQSNVFTDIYIPQRIVLKFLRT
jgi:hypothetical protein